MFTVIGVSMILLAFMILFIRGSGREVWILRAVVLVFIAWQFLLYACPYFASVPSGSVGVKTVFGKVQKDATLSDGLHFVMPWEKVIQLDLRTQKYSTAIVVRSKDQQKVTMKLSVNYTINPEKVLDVVEQLVEDGDTTVFDEQTPDSFGKSIPDELGRAHGDIIKKVLIPMLYEVTNKCVANHGIAQIMGKRAEIRDDFLASLRDLIAKDKYGFLLISDVLIDDIDFSDKYEQAIIAKTSVVQQIQQTEYELQAAEAKAEKLRQEGIGVKNAAIATANGVAAAKRSEGENTAKSTIAKATAQAEGYIKLAESYSPTILALEVLEKWDGKFPTVSIDLSGDGASGQPLLLLPQATSK